MNHLVTFSTPDMERSAGLCVESARKQGVSEGHADIYTRAGIDYSDADRSEDVIALMGSNPRGGGGCFAWKPFVILDAMRMCGVGDTLIYSDAGIEFIDDVGHIMNYMDQDIFLFGNNWEHAHWCKADVIKEVWPWIPPERAWDGDEWRNWFPFAKQCQASVIFFRVTDHTRAFVKEWLDWCLFEGGRLIDDSPSRAPNHPEFREHRHDQAILTTMAYREGLKLHYWPASYNDGAFVYEKLPEYAGDDYPILFNHHRRRQADWEQIDRSQQSAVSV